MSPNTVIMKKVQQKSQSRYIAEKSIMSMVAFLFTVASTHLMICELDKRCHRVKKMKSKGAHMLEDMAKRANDGVSVYPILLGIIFSTDDSTYFVFK